MTSTTPPATTVADVAPTASTLVAARVLRYFRDFPKPGINFVDICPVMAHHEARSEIMKLLADRYRGRVDAIAGLESRGFYFACPLACDLGLPFVPLRKPGKLPGTVVQVEYGKEYGKDIIQVQADAFTPGSRVLIVDDLMATGGTAKAACELVLSCHAVVSEVVCIIELAELNGKARLPTGIPFHSLIQL
ncbi:adenine phosphoribosyltransferase [Pelomyxa schiedti]|nr:adenine phosphoribosyltransferase [Pelomyxa schiedti]